MRFVLALALAGVLLAPSPARAAGLADDPLAAYQWALHNSATPGADMAVPEAWSSSEGAGATVAVVDTGVDVGHPDQPVLDPRSRSFLAGDDPTLYADADGHGTKVAGVIAAPDNGRGTIGVAPRADVLVLRAFGAEGTGDDAAIAAALDFAGDEHVPVVNASFNGPASSPLIEAAITSHPDTLFVVAAGNDGADDDAIPTYPCDLPADNVLCVGASTNADAPAAFSNVGAHSVDLFAPGLSVLAPVLRALNPKGYWMNTQGTSIAAANVSGVAALVLGAVPTLTAAELKDALLESGDRIDALAPLSATGRRVNAAKAVALALAGPVPPDVDGNGIADADERPAPAPTPIPAPAPAPSPAPAPVPVTPAPSTPVTVTGSVASALVTMPALTAFRVEVPRRGHRVTATARTDGRARLALSIERRRCAGARCTWATVARRSTTGTRASLTRSLASGRYRATVALRAKAGVAAPRHRAFAVR